MKDLIALSHEQALKARAIERFILNDTFIFEPEDKDKVMKLVESLDLDGLKEYVNGIRERKLITMSYRKLRDLAKRRHIPNYSRLTQLELIDANRKWEATHVGEDSDTT